MSQETIKNIYNMKQMNTPNPDMDKTMLNKKPVNAAAAAAVSAGPSLWKSVLVGGVPGILIGASGTAAFAAGAPGAGEAREIAEAGVPGEPQTSEEVAGTVEDSETGSAGEAQATTILEAHSVSDDMSFSQAFASARAEVGPGGAFVWHGQVYGTYRADDEEWMEMSAADRAEHSQTILSQVHAQPYTPTENEPSIIEYNPYQTDTDVQISDDLGDDGEVDVHIVGVDQVELEDGSELEVGYGEVDGMDAVFVDTTGDGEVDTVLIDLDGDGHVGLGEVFDAEGSGLTLDQISAEAELAGTETLDDHLYAGMPDYTNDADMGSLA